jgi:quercetin dioxygenase-like cupin family protein
MFRVKWSNQSAPYLTVVFSVLVIGSLGCRAQEIPGGPEASPNIYHVIAEDELMRLVHIIWPPGARDNWHGHPATSVFYETDCHVRVFFPDGSQRDLQRKAGTGRARSRPVIKHSVQNIGDKECRMVHTEIKSEN